MIAIHAYEEGVCQVGKAAFYLGPWVGVLIALGGLDSLGVFVKLSGFLLIAMSINSAPIPPARRRPSHYNLKELMAGTPLQPAEPEVPFRFGGDLDPLLKIGVSLIDDLLHHSGLSVLGGLMLLATPTIVDEDLTSLRRSTGFKDAFFWSPDPAQADQAEFIIHSLLLSRRASNAVLIMKTAYLPNSDRQDAGILEEADVRYGVGMCCCREGLEETILYPLVTLANGHYWCLGDPFSVSEEIQRLDFMPDRKQMGSKASRLAARAALLRLGIEPDLIGDFGQ